MNDELHRAVQRAVKDERTRLMSALLKFRNKLDGKAKEQTGNDKTAEAAFHEAAGDVAEFVTEQFGE